MKMLKVLAAFLIFSFPPLSVMAESSTSLPTVVKKDMRQFRKIIKEEKKETKVEMKSVRQNIENLMDNLRLRFAKIINGTIASINGATLTVINSQDGKTYTVNTDANTKFRRLYWGISSLSEMSKNDKVNISGKFTDQAKMTILADIIRDLSIMKRFGVFIGTISAISGNSFTMQTVNRGVQKVTISTSTKFINRKDQIINLKDLQSGHTVRVRGMWDKNANTITEVSEVKDFSLPPQPTKQK